MRGFARLLLFCAYASATNIVVTNDDGWAVANVRAQFSALTDAGFNVSHGLQQPSESELTILVCFF